MGDRGEWTWCKRGTVCIFARERRFTEVSEPWRCIPSHEYITDVSRSGSSLVWSLAQEIHCFDDARSKKDHLWPKLSARIKEGFFFYFIFSSCPFL